MDHFGFAIEDTFKLRYLVNDTWRKAENAPIFFYTGNEGRIEIFAENTVRLNNSRYIVICCITHII